MSINSYDPSRLTSYDPSQAARQAAPQTNGYDPNGCNAAQTNAYGQPQAGGYNAAQTNAYGQPQAGGYNAAQTNAYGQPQTGGYNAAQTNAYGQPQTGGYNAAQTAGFAGTQMGDMQYGSSYGQQGTYPKPKTGAKTGLAVGIFLAGIAGMVITSRTAPALCIAIFGGMFAGFGILAAADKQKKYPEERMMGISFILFGLLFLIAPIYLHIISRSGSFTPDEVNARMKTVIGAASMLIGLGALVLPLISDKMKRDRCTLSVEAKCVEVLSRVSSGSSRGRRHRHRVYAPVWEYWCDGRQIRKAESTYSNISVPQVGSTAELKVNPDDPEDLYRRNSAAKFLTALIGAIFIGVGMLVMFVA